MNLDFQPMSKKFFTSFVFVTNFDLLPSSDLNDLIVNGVNEKEFNERFSDLGYDSTYAYENIGSFLYYVLIILGFLFIALLSKMLSALHTW